MLQPAYSDMSVFGQLYDNCNSPMSARGEGCILFLPAIPVLIRSVELPQNDGPTALAGVLLKNQFVVRRLVVADKLYQVDTFFMHTDGVCSCRIVFVNQ